MKKPKGRDEAIEAFKSGWSLKEFLAFLAEIGEPQTREELEQWQAERQQRQEQNRAARPGAEFSALLLMAVMVSALSWGVASFTASQIFDEDTTTSYIVGQGIGIYVLVIIFLLIRSRK